MFFLCKPNFWLNREEIKKFWSKILHSLWSPCILDSIEIILGQDWSWIIARIDRNLPFNAEQETEQIHFNRRDLKPNLYVNPVSSVILLYHLQ